jgi:hypothetical protein
VLKAPLEKLHLHGAANEAQNAADGSITKINQVTRNVFYAF